MRDAQVAGGLQQHVAVHTSGWVFLSLVLLWIVHRIWPALFIPWWFNTDEVVFYYELIRQLRLDPSQTFFDIPGTPYTTVVSVLTSAWWLGARLFGLTPADNPSDFAFANIQGVFTLMRALTLVLYLGATGLAFDLFRRCAGALTAVLAALLMATLPTHVHYSHFVRTESLGLALTLSAIWIVLHSSRRGSPRLYLLAGLMTGVAMGARYHYALVGPPIILAIWLLRDRSGLPAESRPPASRAPYAIASGLAAVFLAGGFVALALQARLIGAGRLTDVMLLTTPAGPGQYAAAKEIVAGLWIFLGLGAALLLLILRLPGLRSRLVWLVNPFTLLLGIGFVAGFVLSHPSFLWRGEHQLRSIQFYRDWTDPGLVGLGLFRSWLKVTIYYFTAAFPERWLQAAFVAGAGLICWKRNPSHLAFLLGAAVCFIAHPVTMKLWPHHVIPWLPFLCLVAATPAAMFGDLLAKRLKRWAAGPVAVVLLSASIAMWACASRFGRVDEYLKISRSRTDRIAEMTRWLAGNVPPEGNLLFSYFALNEDGFYRWIESAGVQVPAFINRRRNARIWWLERSAVDGQAGYLCISKADIVFFREDFERRSPGSTYDPFTDAAFRPVARFGEGFYEIQVFEFDLRKGGGR